MAESSDHTLAAALLVATESGMITVPEAVRLVDRAIAERPVAAQWLIESALARWPEDVLHVLRQEASGHQLVSDALSRLEALALALVRRPGTELELAGRVAAAYPYDGYPSDLRQLLYDLDEEVGCAHAHGGVPSPAHIADALHKLLNAVVGRSAWRADLVAVAAMADQERAAAEQGLAAVEGRLAPGHPSSPEGGAREARAPRN